MKWDCADLQILITEEPIRGGKEDKELLGVPQRNDKDT